MAEIGGIQVLGFRRKKRRSTGGGVRSAPVNSIAPSIYGPTDIGDTLYANPGTWAGSPPPSLGGQWKRDGVNISGATAYTYVITEDDIATDITFTETATNSEGSDSETSNTLSIPYPPGIMPVGLLLSITRAVNAEIIVPQMNEEELLLLL